MTRATVDTSGLEEELQDLSKEASGDLARRWFTYSQDLLLDRGESYPGEADQAEVQSVVQSAQPPQWNGEAWEFSYNHIAAPFFEFGTEAHKITPNPPTEFLKFPWPDAPDEIQERFEDQWADPTHWLEEPEVLLREVNHPGTPELRYVRDSRDRAASEVGE